MYLTTPNIRKILCLAITENVLILTADIEDAQILRREIVVFMRKILELTVRTGLDEIYCGGYCVIRICAVKVWNKCNTKIPFGGAVLVTDKSITDIQNIERDVKIKFLPIDKKDDSHGI